MLPFFFNVTGKLYGIDESLSDCEKIGKGVDRLIPIKISGYLFQ